MRIRQQVAAGASPFLFVTYSIAFLLSANVGQVPLGAGLRSLLLGWLITAVNLYILLALTRDLERAAVYTSLLLILFFSYGHTYQALASFPSEALSLGRHRALAPVYLLLLALGLILLRRVSDATRWARALTLISAGLLIISLASWTWSTLAAQRAESRVETAELDPATGRPIELADNLNLQPDIYYIILDAYGRADSLNRLLGIDNQGFVASLESRGFFVASCAQANYAQTELSLASSLNVAHLDDLGDTFSADRDDRQGLRALIQDSFVEQFLEAKGYETVAFETGFPFSELRGVDRFIAPTSRGLLEELTPFEYALLRSTAGLLVMDGLRVLFPAPDRASPAWTQRHIERSLLTLDMLGSGDLGPGPQFIFAHVIPPHTPFIFGPSGPAEVPPDYESASATYATRMDWYQRGYADHLQYLNPRILEIVDQILATSDPEPVILIQGDHGPEEGGSGDRMAILNAYYLPGRSNLLYESVSPVNSFRMVFNRLWGAGMPLLEDTAYFSTYNRPFDYSIQDNAGCPAD